MATPPPNTISDDGIAATQSGMLDAIIRLLTLTGFGTFVILIMLPLAMKLRALGHDLPVAERLTAGGFWSIGSLIENFLLLCLAVAVTVGLHYLLKRLQPFLDANASAQARFLDTLDPKYVDAAIIASAALSLFLELALIRWYSSVLEFLAFYKNFSLLACFAGLGLGYALANRDRIPLLLVIPLLSWQFAFMLAIRLVPELFRVIPFREQLSMGIGEFDWLRALALYVLLVVVFLITALTFVPVGQLCGRLMERRNKLRAYGLNLLGSLVGVFLMLTASFLWTPPLVWFALCFLTLLLFHLRQSKALIAGIAFSMVCTVVLAWWPVSPLWNRVYSPYQLLEIGANGDTGLSVIRAAGFYYQRIHDLSSKSGVNKIRDYYDFPYKVATRLDDVAVVGAGTGNDVAAALRAKAGRVDAIEIDPVILLVGKENHPENPYSNPRTQIVNNDARSFLRRTDRSYDLIVYGLLDSHTLLSQGSSVRLDSFVYTIEGLREARSRLKPGGIISLSFTVLSTELGHKIYLMMQQVFDGRPPAVVETEYDGSIVFIESNDKNWVMPPNLVSDAGFRDRAAVYGNPALQATVSTDDWPFFYMPRRVYPVSYLIMIGLILVLSLGLAGNFLHEAPKFSNMSFLWLGVGFMLIETKNITEMGLTFGNTWQVIGFVIVGILTMAFLGNYATYRLDIKRPYVPYVLLWAALALGWWVSSSGGFPSTPLGRLETAVVLALPFVFSGIVFSTLLSSTKGQVSGAMAMNLLGAICGGLLEYNSMYFGFRSLYLVAFVCYLLALLSDLALTSPRGAPSPP